MAEEDLGNVSLDKVAQFAGMIFHQGLQLLKDPRQEDERFFLRKGWASVASLVNDQLDGQHKVSELAERLRQEYLKAAEIPDYPAKAREMILWEAVLRALFGIVEEGEIAPDNDINLWFEWTREKVAKYERDQEAAGLLLDV